MFPGKGAHLILNERYLNFVRAALEDIQKAYSDELHDASPDAVISSLVGGDEEFEWNWTREKDNFGDKAYTAQPYKKGELRITVVKTKQDELRLDIREWFTND